MQKQDRGSLLTSKSTLANVSKVQEIEAGVTFLHGLYALSVSGRILKTTTLKGSVKAKSQCLLMIHE